MGTEGKMLLAKSLGPSGVQIHKSRKQGTRNK